MRFRLHCETLSMQCAGRGCGTAAKRAKAVAVWASWWVEVVVMIVNLSETKSLLDSENNSFILKQSMLFTHKRFGKRGFDKNKGLSKS